jgi:hypothetical protein
MQKTPMSIHQTVPFFRDVDYHLLTRIGYQVHGHIECILNRTQSLNDLSADDIIELGHISKRSLVINKVRVSLTDYRNWLDKLVGDDIRGVEYDAQNTCLVLKEFPGLIHEVAADVVREIFYQIPRWTECCFWLGLLLDWQRRYV